MAPPRVQMHSIVKPPPCCSPPVPAVDACMTSNATRNLTGIWGRSPKRLSAKSYIDKENRGWGGVGTDRDGDSCSNPDFAGKAGPNRPVETMDFKGPAKTFPGRTRDRRRQHRCCGLGRRSSRARLSPSRERSVDQRAGALAQPRTVAMAEASQVHRAAGHLRRTQPRAGLLRSPRAPAAAAGERDAPPAAAEKGMRALRSPDLVTALDEQHPRVRGGVTRRQAGRVGSAERKAQQQRRRSCRHAADVSPAQRRHAGGDLPADLARRAIGEASEVWCVTAWEAPGAEQPGSPRDRRAPGVTLPGRSIEVAVQRDHPWSQACLFGPHHHRRAKAANPQRSQGDVGSNGAAAAEDDQRAAGEP